MSGCFLFLSQKSEPGKTTNLANLNLRTQATFWSLPTAILFFSGVEVSRCDI